MKDVQWMRGLAFGAMTCALGACATGPGAPSGVTAQAPAMQRAENMAGTAVWRKPGLNPAQYTSFTVAPVKVYTGADADFGGATEAEKQAMAAFMQREFTRVLGERYPAASASSRNAARLELTLAGMSGNVPVAATAASVLPLGLVRNMVAGGQSPVFSGSVTYKGDLYDTRTGELLTSFVTSKTPSTFDVVATMSSTAAQQAAVTESAYDLREAISAAQQQAARPAG